MKESTHSPKKAERPGFYAWWSTRTGTWTALGILALVCAGLIFGQLSTLGIWKPWEAQEIRIAREYANPAETSDDATSQKSAQKSATATSTEQTTAANATPASDWSTPTLDGKPVARPLLKTWILAASVGDSAEMGEYKVGELELSARLPFAVAIVVLILLSFAWIRRYFDTWSALACTVAFTTTPAIFLGVHTLSSEMLFLVLSSASIMAFFELSGSKSARTRWLWGAALGITLSFCFLEQRFFGLLSPLAVIVAFCVAELPFEQVARARQNPSGVSSITTRVDIGLAIAALVGAGGVLLWGLNRSAQAPGDATFLPHVLQWIAILVPGFVLLAGLFIGRKSRAGRALFSGPMLLAAAICVGVAAVVVQAYGSANPMRILNGEISGKIPLFSFLLENHLSGDSPAAGHMYFAMWIREIGFSLVPWVALVPLGLGYLARAARLQDEDGAQIKDILSAQSSLQRLLLVWSFIAVAIVALASAYNHFYFPAYLPLMLGVGLMLGDAEFFNRARLRSLTLVAMGFVAITIIMMLGKDLERFPDRFMEPYLAMQEQLGLPDDYSFGSMLKAIKYGWVILLATFYFGLVSSLGLTLRSLRSAPKRFAAWRARRKERAKNSTEIAPDETQSPQHSPFYQRAQAKQAYRRESGVLPRLAALAELPSAWSVWVLLAAVFTAGVFLYQFAPDQSAHLSERGIFEAFTKAAKPGDKLYRYGISGTDGSVYLGDVASIPKNQAFNKDFENTDRYFVIIPRKRLAAINYDVRKRFGRNLPVIDASSSKLLLVSNQLKSDEQKNYIADAIIEDPENFESPMPLKFANKGKIMPPTFDDSLELVGWDINHKKADGSFPEFGWGENAELTFYFRVKKRVPRSQEIFMHVDRAGSRLHGDHDPVHGEFPTNYWLPGDIVKDEYSLHIDSYSTPGVYTIWLGFFHSKKRMKVTPKQATDGDNRVRVGQFVVNGML